MNEVRIYCCGVFDLLHVGHLRYLEKAKSFGDYLIVGVHRDKDVRSYKRTPIVPYSQRVALLEALKIVDEVIEGPLETTKSFYIEHQIDLHVQGHTKGEFEAIWWQYRHGERLHMVKLIRTPPHLPHTSDIIERCRNLHRTWNSSKQT